MPIRLPGDRRTLIYEAADPPKMVILATKDVITRSFMYMNRIFQILDLGKLDMHGHSGSYGGYNYMCADAGIALIFSNPDNPYDKEWYGQYSQLYS